MTETANFVPVTVDVNAYRGDDIVVPLTFRPTGEPDSTIDVSDWEFSAQVRTYANATDSLADFTIDDADAADGKISLVLSAEDCAALPALPLAWDLQRIVDGKTRTLIKGAFSIDGDVTR